MCCELVGFFSWVNRLAACTLESLHQASFERLVFVICVCELLLQSPCEDDDTDVVDDEDDDRADERPAD